MNCLILLQRSKNLGGGSGRVVAVLLLMQKVLSSILDQTSMLSFGFFRLGSIHPLVMCTWSNICGINKRLGVQCLPHCLLGVNRKLHLSRSCRTTSQTLQKRICLIVNYKLLYFFLIFIFMPKNDHKVPFSENRVFCYSITYLENKVMYGNNFFYTNNANYFCLP